LVLWVDWLFGLLRTIFSLISSRSRLTLSLKYFKPFHGLSLRYPYPPSLAFYRGHYKG